MCVPSRLLVLSRAAGERGVGGSKCGATAANVIMFQVNLHALLGSVTVAHHLHPHPAGPRPRPRPLPVWRCRQCMALAA